MVGEFWSDYSVGLSYVEITIELYLFYFFLKNSREKKPEKQIQGSFSLTFASFIFFFALADIFYMIFNYTLDFRFLVIARILMVTGILAILLVGRVFLSEIIKTERNRIIYVLIGIVFFMILIPTYSYYTETTRILFVFLGLIYALPYLFFFVKWIIKYPGNIRKYLLILFIGVVLLFLGELNPFSFFVYPFETIIGPQIFIAGLLILSVGATGLPSLAELDWRKKIQELYLLAPGEICFFAYSFGSNQSLDPTLKRNWTQLLIDKHTLHEIGKFLTIAITVKEDLDIFRTKMHLLLEETERLYQAVIPRWSGNITAFNPLNTIIKDIFQ